MCVASLQQSLKISFSSDAKGVTTNQFYPLLILVFDQFDRPLYTVTHTHS